VGASKLLTCKFRQRDGASSRQHAVAATRKIRQVFLGSWRRAYGKVRRSAELRAASWPDCVQSSSVHVTESARAVRCERSVRNSTWSVDVIHLLQKACKFRPDEWLRAGVYSHHIDLYLHLANTGTDDRRASDQSLAQGTPQIFGRCALRPVDPCHRRIRAPSCCKPWRRARTLRFR